jgi:hypothetical protein
MIEDRFKGLRVTLRNESRPIIQHILRNHFDPWNFAGEEDVCIFCNSAKNITKEHVLPKWAFQKSTKSYFVTDVNGASQTYNKTTVPACSNCNNSQLANIESYIINLFRETNLDEGFFSSGDLQNVIRWLEIIEYKFHVLEFRRKFKSSKSSGYIPFIANVPISVMRRSIKLSPSKAVAQLRQSQKRITIKDKTLNVNSLVLFKTKNKSYHFFHTMNEFIFLELPEFKIAVFYFYTRAFGKAKDAHKEAMKIIESVY